MSPINAANIPSPAATSADGVDTGSARDADLASAAFAELLRSRQSAARCAAAAAPKVAANSRQAGRDAAADGPGDGIAPVIGGAGDGTAPRSTGADSGCAPSADPTLRSAALEPAPVIAPWLPPPAQSGSAPAESLTASILAQRAQSGLPPAEVALATAPAAPPGDTATLPAGTAARDAGRAVITEDFRLASAIDNGSSSLAQTAPRSGRGEAAAPGWSTLSPAVDAAAAARGDSARSGAEAGAISPAATPPVNADTAIARADPGAWAAQAVPVDAAAARSSASVPHALAVDAAVGTPRFADETAQQVTWMAKNGIEQAEIRVKPAELGPISVRIEMNHGEATISFAVTQPETRVAVEDALHRLQEMLAESGISLGQTSVGGQDFGQTSRDSGTAQRNRVIFAASGTSRGAVERGLPAAAARNGVQRGMVDTFA